MPFRKDRDRIFDTKKEQKYMPAARISHCGWLCWNIRFVSDMSVFFTTSAMSNIVTASFSASLPYFFLLDLSMLGNVGVSGMGECPGGLFDKITQILIVPIENRARNTRLGLDRSNGTGYFF